LPALRLIARGFRYHIGFAELILINSGTSLLSSFIPVPGGIGVVEFSLEVGPPSAGMTASAAAATIRLYRFATFYLPPLWASSRFAGSSRTTISRSAGEAGDGVTDQLRADEEEEHRHDHCVVTGHPASETVQKLARPVAERE
jgi:hypothetical protein